MSNSRTSAKMIDDLLQEANGKLYSVMSCETIAALLRLVADKEQMLWARSHETTFGYGSSSQATFAFCARISANKLRIAITRGPAKSGSPGRAWPMLRPWRPGTRSTDEKIKFWLKISGTDEVQFSLSMAGSVAAELAKLAPFRWRFGSDSSNQIFAVEHGNPVVG
jgi:hypothetical protein